jgi:hypothetical protein
MRTRRSSHVHALSTEDFLRTNFLDAVKRKFNFGEHPFYALGCIGFRCVHLRARRLNLHLGGCAFLHLGRAGKLVTGERDNYSSVGGNICVC